MSFYQSPSPLAGSTLPNLIYLLIKNSFDAAYLPKVRDLIVLALFGAPIRLWETVKFGQQIRSTPIEQAPIFIIGHWRSGTTYIHNLLSQDPQFGYVTCYQAWAPGQTFTQLQAISRATVQKCMPPTRPMDNIEFQLDSPQEEEYVLANLSPYSFYHGWYFPQNIEAYFNKYVLFQGISPRTRQQWQQVYRHVLQVATMAADGKQLILKNPTNTARIKFLLELFPDAKFIHIHRNPYEVYYSTRCLYNRLIPTHTVQVCDPATLEEKFLKFYQQLMHSYFEQKHLIPADHLIELRYDKLEQNPIADLERIYQQFNLPGFEQVAIHFQHYIAQQANYTKNQHVITENEIAKVYRHWQFTIDRWGYSAPDYSVAASHSHSAPQAEPSKSYSSSK